MRRVTTYPDDAVELTGPEYDALRRLPLRDCQRHGPTMLRVLRARWPDLPRQAYPSSGDCFDFLGMLRIVRAEHRAALEHGAHLPAHYIRRTPDRVVALSPLLCPTCVEALDAARALLAVDRA